MMIGDVMDVVGTDNVDYSNGFGGGVGSIDVVGGGGTSSSGNNYNTTTTQPEHHNMESNTSNGIMEESSANPATTTGAASDSLDDTNGTNNDNHQPPVVVSSLHDDVHSLPTVAAVTRHKDRRVIAAMDLDDYHENDEDIYEDENAMNPMWIFICLLVVLIATSIGLGLGLEPQDDAERSEILANENEGYRDYIHNPMFRTIVDYLGNHSISNYNDMLFEGTPQNKAIHWMANVDSAGATTEHYIPYKSPASEEGYVFLTRYVLAVIYYGMGGETSWTNTLNFLDPTKHTCDWFDIIVSQYQMFPRGVGCYDDESHLIDALFLDANNVHGSIPQELGLLSTIRIINLELNTIEGTIPTSLLRITSLQHLSMAHNTLSGSFPNFIHYLSRLETLDVSYNYLSGTLPQTLRQGHDALIALAVDNNLLRGNLQNVFGTSGQDANVGTFTNSYMFETNTNWGYTNLGVLYGEDNYFQDTLNETFLTGMTNLRRLDLSNNELNGTIPSHLLQYSQLEILDLHDNHIDGRLPTRISTNFGLQFLALQQNNIGGAIPPTISNLRSLTHLDLSQNSFSGQIPGEIAGMQNLTYLFLSQNPFGPPGPIPTFLQELTNLQELSLQSTQRTGRLPQDMFSSLFLHKLILLDLHDNQLSGTIPTSLATIQNLQFLLLNQNQLTGTVPLELQNLVSLRLFFIDENEITGDLENVFCDRIHQEQENGRNEVFIPYIVADCGVPGVEVTCTCCFKCCSNNEQCNDDQLIPSHDPMWQFGYQRIFYVFGDRTAFFASP